MTRDFNIDETMLVNLADFTSIPIFYDRDKTLGYGVPVRKDDGTPKHQFFGHYELGECLRRLEALFEKIGWRDHILGMLTAGARYDKFMDKKKTKPSPHHIKRGATAIDIDGFIVDSSSFLGAGTKEIRTYLREDDDIKTRLAALCYVAGFTTVLTWHTKNHKDHIHADLTNEPGWHGYKSQVRHVQESLNAWRDAGLKVDGDFGTKTKNAFENCAGQIFTDCEFAIKTYWQHFNETIALNAERMKG